MSTTANIALLENRAILRMEGIDRFTFLQDLVSQDMDITKDGSPLFTAFLTPQGKYLFDLFIIPDRNTYLLDVETDRRADFIARLTRYRLRANITLEDISPSCEVFAAWDGGALPGGFSDPRLPALGQRLIAKKGAGPKSNVGEKEYRNHRYAHGVAEGWREIAVGSATLADVNFDVLNAVSFNKGCYLGQELTARMHHRALVKKRYLPFRFDGQFREKSNRIQYGGYDLGEIHALGDGVGLGLFNLETVKPYLDGTPLTDGSVVYEIFVPDYLKPVLTR